MCGSLSSNENQMDYDRTKWQLKPLSAATIMANDDFEALFRSVTTKANETRSATAAHRLPDGRVHLFKVNEDLRALLECFEVLGDRPREGLYVNFSVDVGLPDGATRTTVFAPRKKKDGLLTLERAPGFFLETSLAHAETVLPELSEARAILAPGAPLSIVYVTGENSFLKFRDKWYRP